MQQSKKGEKNLNTFVGRSRHIQVLVNKRLLVPDIYIYIFKKLWHLNITHTHCICIWIWIFFSAADLHRAHVLYSLFMLLDPGMLKNGVRYACGLYHSQKSCLNDNKAAKRLFRCQKYRFTQCSEIDTWKNCKINLNVKRPKLTGSVILGPSSYQQKSIITSEARTTLCSTQLHMAMCDQIQVVGEFKWNISSN